MRINTYKTKLNDDNLTILVKEKGMNYNNCETFNKPSQIADFMNTVFDMKNLAEEYCYLLVYNGKMRLIGVFELSHGSVNASILNPREVFIRALLCGGTNIILCHNHPSGITYPSKEDNMVTKRIKEVGDLLGLKLVDHIIIGDNYMSYGEDGLL